MLKKKNKKKNMKDGKHNAHTRTRRKAENEKFILSDGWIIPK